MANTFVTTDLVVRDAAIQLQDNLVAANLVNRNHEDEFKKKVGDTIRVKVPPVQTARDFIDDSLSTTASNITETYVSLQLTEQPYVRHDLTTAEKTMSLDDFNELVTKPCVLAIRDAIDAYIIKVMTQGFALYFANTEGSSPSTVAHLVAARKVLEDNGCPKALRRSILDTTAEASLLQLVQFTNADYGADAPNGLKEAMLNRRYGIDWYADQNATAHSRGDIAGTVLTDGTPVLAASTLHVDGFTAATGTVYRGTRFTVAGDTTVYTLTADATLASNECDFTISPTVTADLVTAGDGAAVTFKSAIKEDVLFHRDAVAAAIVPPIPLAVNSSVAIYNGVGIRVTSSSSTASLSDTIVFDTYCGCQIVQAKGGCVFGGT